MLFALAGFIPIFFDTHSNGTITFWFFLWHIYTWDQLNRYILIPKNIPLFLKLTFRAQKPQFFVQQNRPLTRKPGCCTEIARSTTAKRFSTIKLPLNFGMNPKTWWMVVLIKIIKNNIVTSTNKLLTDDKLFFYNFQIIEFFWIKD